VTKSIFWHDYETTGIDPRRDRPLQVAGIRTDEALNPIGEPVNLYCRPSDDILPHPAACLITGITPQRLAEQGLDEAPFMARVHAELSQPGTCGAGYNSLRFDDEVTRFSLYRNFHDPYAREWQGGNSRWDLIDVVRTAYALRPEGIQWPQLDGQVSLRLESLSAANGLEHGQAHDALSDVRATIALARLLRQAQPKLYDYLYELRSKARVSQSIQLLKPMVHISGRFSAARHYLGTVLPLAWHPSNRNALIVCDLQGSWETLLEEDAESLRQRLYTRRDQLAEGQRPVPLKLIHVNRCPVVLPLAILRDSDRERLGVDVQQCLDAASRLRDSLPLWQHKLELVYADADFAEVDDPEQQLYAGFMGDRDRRLCEQVRQAVPRELGERRWSFDDTRLSELLFRYRARNFPDSLDAQERQQWQQFCVHRLTRSEYGAPNTLTDFDAALAASLPTAGEAGREILLAWQKYAEQLRQRYFPGTPGVN
jgi:exodeoxyribonuclease-1